MIIFNNRHVILIFYEYSFIQKYCLPLNILKPKKIQESLTNRNINCIKNSTVLSNKTFDYLLPVFSYERFIHILDLGDERSITLSEYGYVCL